MKKNILKIVFIGLFFLNPLVFSKENVNVDEKVSQAYALYATKNFNEAKNILENLPKDTKNEETFLILGNIAQENKDFNLAIKNYNKAIDINNAYYKAYYNIGLIFAQKQNYEVAINNFDIAAKYKRDFAPAYYNLACCQMAIKDYRLAKKNLLRAINIDSTNKDYYYNLILCYKKLDQIKQANKILETYNQMK